MERPEDGPDGQQQHSTCVPNSTPAVRPRATEPGVSVADISPMVGPVVMKGSIRQGPYISQPLRC